MVSYYNLPYAQKHSAANLAYSTGQPWQWATNYPAPSNHQFISEMESPHTTHHPMYYGHHPMFHTAGGGTTSEWHSPAHSENFAAATAHHAHMHHALNGVGSGAISNSSTSSGSTGSASAGPVSGNTNLNETNGGGEPPIADGLPSPPITIAGSEISSPGVPASSSSPHHLSHHLNSGNNNNNSPSTNNNNNIINNNNNNNRTSPVKAQYYDWMKKPSYPTQPAPGTFAETDHQCLNSQLDDLTDSLDSSGKTRTKDKYRVVYTDFQRLELEKEYCTSRYITIRRKTELAQSLSLSERQVKIWFQNRRAKERKQNKKTNDPTIGPMGGSIQHNEYINIMDTKPKLEPGLHLQHSLHSIHSSMAHMMHHPLHSHHSLAAVSAAAAAHSHPLHHQTQMSSTASGVGSLAM